MGIKAMIAMSGGVDSAAAAILALRKGYDCTGVTLRLTHDKCFGENREYLQNEEDAANICLKLGIPHKVYDVTADFIDSVVNDFVCSYENGQTPNPCVICNKRIKFGRLWEIACNESFDKLITGHYAKIENDENGVYRLRKADDISKDQSYFLYGIGAEKLEKIEFPLGSLTKPEVRKITEEAGLTVSSKHDSQDICFIPDGDYASFIENYTGKTYAPGNFVDTEGNIKGRHKGLIHYTIGQRKGLGLALPAPLYVKNKDIEANTVILCDNDQLFSKTVYAENVSLMRSDDIFISEMKKGLKVSAKIRYNHHEQPAMIQLIAGEEIQKSCRNLADAGYVLKCIFDEPQRAAAPGQSLVFYDGNICLGGGIITDITIVGLK